VGNAPLASAASAMALISALAASYPAIV